jgi:DNA sulfur modification protein DndD
MRFLLFFDVLICGESIDPSDPSGQKRRIHIQCLIDDSEKSDSLQAAISDLYFQSESLRPIEDAKESEWIAGFTKIFGARQEFEQDLEMHQKQQREAEAKQKQIPKADIQELRRQRDDMQDVLKRAASRESRIKTEQQNLSTEERAIKQKLDQALQHQKKGQRVFNELLATNDIKTVLKNSFDRIKSEELQKVSRMMNELFLQMIGADTDNSIIQRAEISVEFDILVYGPNNRRIDPDTGLNGASRRALTLAFILALTHVSEVEAPNVIDTPLGMMSGYVKRSVFQTAVMNSSQLVLFLTHDEIAGIEELLDKAAGRVVTLTNPAHYPRILVHDPNVYNNILRCNCNHRQVCQICERRLDAESIRDDVTIVHAAE